METKLCKDCKYFKQHYIWYKAGKFSKISYGHCTLPTHKRANIKFPFEDTCEKWEEAEPQKEETVDKIENTVANINRKLNALVNYIETLK